MKGLHAVDTKWCPTVTVNQNNQNNQNGQNGQNGQNNNNNNNHNNNRNSNHNDNDNGCISYSGDGIGSPITSH